jgi:uncharacterized RDD family membrane protein YckC
VREDVVSAASAEGTTVSTPTTPPGWYPAPGDPPGTHRYWNGTDWTTGPTPIGQGMPAPSGTGTVHGKPLASPGLRIAARLIDAVIVFVVLGAIVSALVVSDGDFNQFTEFNIGFTIVGLLISAAYEVGFVIWKGGTPGKLILGLRIVEMENGSTPPDQNHAVMRWVPSLVGYVPILGGLISLVIFIISLVWLFSDANRQTVFDKVGKTFVVKS